MQHAIGVIGGSGMYRMNGFQQNEIIKIKTPYGAPSDKFVGGSISGKQVWFVARHGQRHCLMPHEINHRANLWASKSLQGLNL